MISGVPNSSLALVCGDALKDRELSETFRRSNSRESDRIDDRREPEGSDTEDAIERVDGRIMEERQLAILPKLRRLAELDGEEPSRHNVLAVLSRL